LRLEARSGAWRVYAAQQVFDPLGSLQLSHPLDLDTAPGVSTKALGFSLVYNSSLVVPAPVLQMSLQSPNNQALPGSLYVTLRWYPDGKGSESGSGGRSLSWTLSLAGYAPGDLITMRIPVSADWVTQALRYAWKITVKTSATSSEELASEKGLAFVASTRTAGLNWSMGAGWGFSAVDRLVRLPAEDSLPAGVARVSANGSVAFYEQPTTELGTYGRQPGDPGALRKVNDTTYLYTLPTGEQWQYTSSPPSGSITWWRSADRQEQIMFSFDNTGRLTAVDAGGPTNA